MNIVGVDFTSAPTRHKPIVIAVCSLKTTLTVEQFLEFADWPAYELWLRQSGPWIGGFDFPFGLPRRYVERKGWPTAWSSMVEACVSGGKERFVNEAMEAFRKAKIKLDKHRQTDIASGSESPLKTKANPPVGRMFYEGAWRLISAKINVPLLNETGSSKTALEAYPGLAAKILGYRFYKNDKPTSYKKNVAARADILEQLISGNNPSSICLKLREKRWKTQLLEQETGDWLDAVLCATQAAWGYQRQGANFGLPSKVDPCEGWIVTA